MMALLIVLFLILPLLIKNGFLLTALSLLFINSIAALGLNIVTGWAGQISIGHAAFMSIGAFFSGVLTTHFQLPLFLTLPLSGVVAGFIGYLLGFPSLRLGGFYLAILTMGFGVAIEQLFGWMDITGGHIGLKVVPTLGDLQGYYLSLITLILIYTIFYSVLNGRTGRAWKALRESETVAASFGINVTHYKISAFTVSATLGGIAGAIYAHVIGYIAPSDFGLGKSLELLAMIVIGGLSSLGGSITGAAIYTILPFMFSRSSLSLSIIFGFLLLITVLLFPRGLYYYLKLIYLKYLELPLIWIIRFFNKPEGKFVNTPNGRIHYLEKEGINPPVVFVHGNWGSWKWFKPLIESWNLENKAFALDLPGFGKSEKPGFDISLENYAHSLHKFLKALNIERPVIIAHSMGSSVVIKMLSIHPDSAKALVLISPSPIDGYKTPPEAFPALSLYSSSLSLISKYIRPTIPNRRLAWEIVKDVLLMDKRGFVENPKALLEDLTDVARAISAPVLIIRSKNDPLITTAEYKKTREALRAAEIVFDGGGHNVHLYFPERVLRIMGDFIEEVKT